LAARNPVDKLKLAMAAKCSGSAAINRCASSWRKKRVRRTGSLSMQILGARSNHSHSSTHLRKMPRTHSSVRFGVALLTSGIQPISFAALSRSEDFV
jgi:hypothetical protein